MIPKIVIVGCGKMGQTIAALTGYRYSVKLIDKMKNIHEVIKNINRNCAGKITGKRIDISCHNDFVKELENSNIIVNCTSHQNNINIARAALQTKTSYIDLSEDIFSVNKIAQMTRSADVKKHKQYFIPCCGLAPGFVQIKAYDMIKSFEEINEVKICVGALPKNPSNSLGYNITWSVDGLINEYTNQCKVLVNGNVRIVDPLGGHEKLTISGGRYESFYTSGGIGTLAETLAQKKNVKNAYYKTIRYCGHHQLMKFLLFDLGLSDKKGLLKDILVSSLPETDEDVVIIFITISGWKNNKFLQDSYVKYIYSDKYHLLTQYQTAIQKTTASSASAIIDLIIQDKIPHYGYVKQEEIQLSDFFLTSFGKVFQH
ncbi:MAG: saccharopine dehydrogenase C-terminal domain-containing protein [Atribacterota bacterium]